MNNVTQPVFPPSTVERQGDALDMAPKAGNQLSLINSNETYLNDIAGAATHLSYRYKGVNFTKSSSSSGGSTPISNGVTVKNASPWEFTRAYG